MVEELQTTNPTQYVKIDAYQDEDLCALIPTKLIRNALIPTKAV